MIISTLKSPAAPRRAAFATAVLLLGSVLAPPPALAQTPETVRVRGSVVAVDGSVLTVKSRQGADVAIKLPGDVHVLGVHKASISDIKPGVFIGTAAAPKGGSSHALEVVIFPEALRGVGEGDRPWDLTPDSTMTNGTIGSAVEGVDGPTVTVAYKGGERKVTIGPDTPVVTLGPADASDIKPGTAIFITARKQENGGLTAGFVTVGKDGVVPPM
jgi:hypothetical protein